MCPPPSLNEAHTGLKAGVSREILRSQPYFAKATKGSTTTNGIIYVKQQSFIPSFKKLWYSGVVE